MQTREGWTEEELTVAREKAKAKAGNGNGFGLGLGAVAGMWATPAARDYRREEASEEFNEKRWAHSRGKPLSAAVTVWPTPSAMQDTKGDADIGAIERREALGKQIGARQFSRPAHLTAPLGPKLSQLRLIWHPLRASLIASHGRAVWRRLWASRTKARLNPAFVAWLMGWPPGHASCTSSATAWSLWQRDMRGALCRLPTASGAWIWRPSIERMKPVQRDLFAELDA